MFEIRHIGSFHTTTPPLFGMQKYRNSHLDLELCKACIPNSFFFRIFAAKL